MPTARGRQRQRHGAWLDVTHALTVQDELARTQLRDVAELATRLDRQLVLPAAATSVCGPDGTMDMDVAALGLGGDDALTWDRFATFAGRRALWGRRALVARAVIIADRPGPSQLPEMVNAAVRVEELADFPCLAPARLDLGPSTAPALLIRPGTLPSGVFDRERLAAYVVRALSIPRFKRAVDVLALEWDLRTALYSDIGPM